MVNQDLDGFESKLQLLNEKASPVLLNHIRFNECIDEFLINVLINAGTAILSVETGQLYLQDR